MGRSGCPRASTNVKLDSPAGIDVAAWAAAPARQASASAAARECPGRLRIIEAHRLAHVAHRLVGEVARLLAAVLDDVAHERRILLELDRALADGLQLRV